MAEQSLLEGKFSVRVMPVPSAIRAGCGFCLRLIPEELERAAAFLAELGIVLADIYLPEGEPVSYKKMPLATLINGKKHDAKH